MADEELPQASDSEVKSPGTLAQARNVNDVEDVDEVDDEFDENDDNGEDYEATLDEEESLAQEDYEDELKDLEDEGEMSIEELRRKYGYPADAEPAANPDCSEDLAAAMREAENESEAEIEDETETETEDGDYAPPDMFKRQQRILLTQAEIPEFKGDCDDEAEDRVIPMWLPSTSLSDSDINDFLIGVRKYRTDTDATRDLKENQFRDEEKALYALMMNKYDLNVARDCIKVNGFPKVAIPERTISANAARFTEEEQEVFVTALLEIGKNFSEVQKQKMSYRLVGELVDYYYKWKRTGSYREYRERILNGPNPSTAAENSNENSNEEELEKIFYQFAEEPPSSNCTPRSNDLQNDYITPNDLSTPNQIFENDMIIPQGLIIPNDLLLRNPISEANSLGLGSGDANNHNDSKSNSWEPISPSEAANPEAHG
ncbi:unnamed protein product [Auanema sp. JU1783]|nr:unnamed protein product [Auanema sp. JU1783]